MNVPNALAAGWVVGLAMGLGIAWLAPSQAPETPGAPAEIVVERRSVTRASTAGATTGSLSAQPAQPEAIPSTELDACRFELDAARGQLAMLGGESTAWPPDLPEPFRREHIEAWFEANRALVDETGEGGDLDCSEFPCVLTVFMPESESSEDLTELRSSLQQHAQNGFVGRTYLRGGPEGASHALAITPMDWESSPSEAKRLQVRMETLTER